MENYRKQYYQLAVNFHDFFVWSNMKQHQYLADKLDIGFAGLKELIVRYQEKNDTKAAAALERYAKMYKSFVEDAVINTNEMDYDSSDSVVFPAKREIFVPQGFKALIYKNNMHLEERYIWEKCKEREGIGKAISDILRSPVIGSVPLLILGHPGAGKSLLCNMLAAEILCFEYHVIIIKLRDTVADQTIPQQINQQIERDFSNGCTWDDIAGSGLKKPILLIFDGYDELLQASGRTYSDYLQKIAEFQKQQRVIYDIFVKCIITSRITLIDKALIANDTPVMMLSDFHPYQIKEWIRIWNDKNKEYFLNSHLDAFEVEEKDRVFELARQPLLLLMLALFDSNDNALKKNKDLNSTQLYDKLIREFISREKRKDDSFRRQEGTKQQKIIDAEMEKISIAALGMYNRRVLFIRSAELQDDINFILHKKNQENSEDTDRRFQNSEITESDKLLGSFFFIHRSDSTAVVNKEKIRNAAYEFLHNTFGEFLTANYIVGETHRILSWVKMLLDGNMLDQWNLASQRAWLICLAYAPLFSRPVVVKMIHEWSESFFTGKNMDAGDIKHTFDLLINAEIGNIVSGESIFALKKVAEEKENPFRQEEILKHLAIYSLNLIILRAITCGGSCELSLADDKWNQLICIWKYGFTEDELSGYANLFGTNRNRNKTEVHYFEEEVNINILQSRIGKLYGIGSVLGDEVLSGTIAALVGAAPSDMIIEILKRNGLNIKARYFMNYLLGVLEYGDFKKNGLKFLKELAEYCREERDGSYLFMFYLLLNHVLQEKLILINNQTEDFVLQNIVYAFGEYNSDYTYKAANLFKFLIDKLAIDLFDYVEIGIRSTEQVLRVCLKSDFFYSNNKGLENFSYLYDKIRKKLTAGNIVYIDLERLADNFERYLELILHRAKEQRLDLGNFVFKPIEVSYDFLLLGVHPFGYRIFKLWMNFKEEGIFGHRWNMTSDQKAVFINYLSVMLRNGQISMDYVVFAWETAVKDASIKKIFNSSHEAAENLCFLLNEHMFLDYKYLEKDLLWILKNRQEEITVRFYKRIYRLAKKGGFEVLNVTLEKLIEM